MFFCQINYFKTLGKFTKKFVYGSFIIGLKFWNFILEIFMIGFYVFFSLLIMRELVITIDYNSNRQLFQIVRSNQIVVLIKMAAPGDDSSQ